MARGLRLRRSLHVVRSAKELIAWRESLRQEDASSLGLVPTMGALHLGCDHSLLFYSEHANIVGMLRC